MTEVPKPTGRVSVVILTGALLPWKDGQPYWVKLEGLSTLYIPIFAHGGRLALHTFMARTQRADYESIKKIDDHDEFLSSIPSDIRLMVDPWFTNDGRLRWAELRGTCCT